MPEEEAVEESREESEPVAEGNALGDLFEYKLKERVTIRKNQSALVPIPADGHRGIKSLVVEQIAGSRAAVAGALGEQCEFADAGRRKLQRAGQQYVRWRGARRGDQARREKTPLLCDRLGLLVDTKLENARERVTRVRIYRGTMTTTSEEREKKTYIVRNEDTTPRTLVIEHPARPEWKLREDGSKPEEKAVGLYRFRLNVEPKKTERLVVNEAKPLYSHMSLNVVTNDQIEFLLRQKSINADIEKALRTVTAQKKVVADLDGTIKEHQKAIDQIFTDQGRLRENMKALKGSAERGHCCNATQSNSTRKRHSLTRCEKRSRTPRRSRSWRMSCFKIRFRKSRWM